MPCFRRSAHSSPLRWGWTALLGGTCHVCAYPAHARDNGTSLAFWGTCERHPLLTSAFARRQTSREDSAVTETELPARRHTPTLRLRRLAGELRALREAAGLTREGTAHQTNINSATLYRIETAKARPQKRTLLTLLDKYGVTDPARRAALVELSQRATQLGWLQAYESELPEEYATYISFESEAGSVRNYESLFVPGLLQTKDYTRAVVMANVPGV